MIFNCVLFGLIVLLVVVLRLAGVTFEVPADSVAEPHTTPETTETASASASPASVLGAATQQARNETLLTPYQSATLKFSAMIPDGWFIERDVLTNYTNKRVVDQQTFSAQDTHCTFSNLSQLPATAEVLEQKDLAEYDLPQIEYVRFRLVQSDAATSEVREKYILKNEQNIAKLELTCLASGGEKTVFYSLLNSVRFLE